MAIASQSPGYTFRIAETLRTFDSHFPDRIKLTDAMGWDIQDVATLDLYRDSAALYSYPPLSELRKILPKTLVEIDLSYGHYELAERCPLLVLERRV